MFNNEQDSVIEVYVVSNIVLILSFLDQYTSSSATRTEKKSRSRGYGIKPDQ